MKSIKYDNSVKHKYLKDRVIKSPRGRKLFATKFDNGLAQFEPLSEPECLSALFPLPSI